MESHSPDLAIIGAGPSGLALALFLQRAVDIFEKNAHVGGHASSFMKGGFTFDYGPHILFSKDQLILDFVVKSLGENVSRCRRNNKISYKNLLLKYPFENGLHALDLEDNYHCISNFLFNPFKEKHAEPQNMKEWFLKMFGEGICAHYLFPYNEKVWNIPVENMSMSFAERIPNPPAEDVLKSALGYSTEGYLHQLYYFYPKKGGYQAICEAWKETLTIRLQHSIEKIQIKEGQIHLFDAYGNDRIYRKIISTMPIHELINIIDYPIPNEIREAIKKLIVNPMIVLSFALRGIDKNQYTAVYFPEKDFWVNRVSFPCTFSKENAPKEHWSLQAEITCAPDSEIWKKSDAEILAHTQRGLQERGLLPNNEHIVFSKIDRINRSYVVYDTGYEEKAEKIRSYFESIGIHLLGRFSYFEYINVDMAIDRAIKLAATLNEETLDKAKYLDRALEKINGETEYAFNG